MEIKNGAEVIAHNGSKIGKVNRIVIDPRTDEITHLVVEKGFLFTTDKVIPVQAVEAERDNRLILSQESPEFSSFPDFEDTTYIPIYNPDQSSTGAATTTPAPVFWYPPVGSAGRYDSPVFWPFTEDTKKHIPKGTVALKEGAEVVDSAENRVGHVKEIFTYEQSGMLTHFLLERGGMLEKHRFLIPENWISRISDDSVHLAVPARLLDELPEYRK